MKNHAKDIWALIFCPVIDLWFRPLYLFFIIELASRRIIHFGVTRSPTDAWVAQQLREATPCEQAPRFLTRDRASKYGETFTRVAVGTSIETLRRFGIEWGCLKIYRRVRGENSKKLCVLGGEIEFAPLKTKDPIFIVCDCIKESKNDSTTLKEPERHFGFLV